MVMKECKYKKYCGGCLGIGVPYNLLLESKTKNIKDLFKEFDTTKIYDCEGLYYPLKYRNKIHLAFTELKGKTLVGFFEEGSTKVVDIDSCELFDKWAIKLIEIIREFLSRFKVRAYVRGNGILRYLHARCVDNNLQFTLVVTSENFPGRRWLKEKLCSEFNEVSFYLNINNRTDRAVFDRKFKFVDGEKYLNFNFLGLKVSLNPSSFLQVNLSIASKMYKKAISNLDINNDTVVVDLYSGIGITSMLFAKNAKKVISIEEVESAVSNAKYIAKNNNINNIEFHLGKCEKILNDIDVESDNLVVFVDPARAGLDIRVIDALKRLNPRKIVYMSCEPTTCKRDSLELLKNSNFKLVEIYPYDMFAYTKHIECLCVFDNK